MRWLVLFIAPLIWAGGTEKLVHFKAATHCKLPLDVVIESPRDVAIDDKGNVYMLDQGTKSVHVWTDKGAYVTTFGGEGKGPGEIAMEDGVGSLAVSKKHIVVVDSRVGKIHMWDRQFNYVKSIPKPGGLGRIMATEAYGQQFIIVATSTRQGNQRLLLVNDEFDLVEVLAVVDDNIYRRNEHGRWDFRPLANLIVVGYGADDVWYANSGENWVRRIDFKGNIVKEFRLSLPVEDLDPKEKVRFIEGFNKWRQDKDTISFPDKQTIIDIVMPLDDNLLAVSQYRSEGGKCSGLVVDKDTGEIRGKFTHFLGDQYGFFASLRGKLVAITGDENDDFRLDLMKVMLEDKQDEDKDEP